MKNTKQELEVIILKRTYEVIEREIIELKVVDLNSKIQ